VRFFRVIFTKEKWDCKEGAEARFLALALAFDSIISAVAPVFLVSVVTFRHNNRDSGSPNIYTAG
jgi:hypothetical protein